MMAACKYKIRKGRYSRDCSLPATDTVTFTTQLDIEHLITVQLPLCQEHLRDKLELFKVLEQPCGVKRIRSK